MSNIDIDIDIEYTSPSQTLTHTSTVSNANSYPHKMKHIRPPVHRIEGYRGDMDLDWFLDSNDMSMEEAKDVVHHFITCFVLGCLTIGTCIYVCLSTCCLVAIGKAKRS